jgi:DNA-binding CsgD family transcriptional regulator
MIHHVDPKLTNREEQIALLLAEGHRDRDIAKLAGITSSTVKCHLRNIREKLGLRTRVQIAVHIWREFSERPSEQEK